MNLSKADFCDERFCLQLEQIRRQWDVPTKYIRIEMTESFTACAKEQVCVAVKQLHTLGCLVEMDDFGSGLSSLNVPKDIEFDIIKPDVNFLSGAIGGRGGAAIFLYRKGTVEVLRVNTKYLKEIGMNMSESDVIHADAWAPFDEKNKEIYIDMIHRAIESGDEEECETRRSFVSIRASVRMIDEIDEQYLFYSMARNITKERKQFTQVEESERRFRAASEQVNIYAWEYNVATREMRPCFRRMRDLGLPALLKNYPDSAIEMGIFPPDYADMYRDWHRQIEQGVAHLEAVIPLTVGRIPFHVRHTTEFDEVGRPVKAYGSAALVVDKQFAP